MQQLTDWLNKIQITADELYSIEWVHSRTNVENFLRTLYFSIYKFDHNHFLLNELIIRLEK